MVSCSSVGAGLWLVAMRCFSTSLILWSQCLSREMNEEELAIFVLVAFISSPNKAEENNSQCQGFHQETPVKASCTACLCQTRVALLSTNYKDAT